MGLGHCQEERGESSYYIAEGQLRQGRRAPGQAGHPNGLLETCLTTCSDVAVAQKTSRRPGLQILSSRRRI